MINFDNKPVVRPGASQVPAQETRVTTNTNVTLPPANEAIKNAMSAVATSGSRVATLNNEFQQLFALNVAPAPKPDPRPVREIAQAEAPNPRELAKKFLG